MKMLPYGFSHLAGKIVLYMCSFKTWYHNENIGYVVECKECKNLQIGFGNVVATVCYQDFEALRKQVAYIKENYSPNKNRLIKSIMLQTPYNGLQFLLTERELDDLYNMLEQTDNERKTAQLLQFFE